jgi:hypothetical protein
MKKILGDQHNSVESDSNSEITPKILSLSCHENFKSCMIFMLSG